MTQSLSLRLAVTGFTTLISWLHLLVQCHWCVRRIGLVLTPTYSVQLVVPIGQPQQQCLHAISNAIRLILILAGMPQVIHVCLSTCVCGFRLANSHLDVHIPSQSYLVGSGSGSGSSNHSGQLLHWNCLYGQTDSQTDCAVADLICEDTMRMTQ